MPSTRTHRPLRRMTTLVAAGVTFTLLPMPFGASVHAQAPATPATAVTGLALGARGDAVKQLQQALVNRGVQVSGGIDGVFGPGTETAVKKFQEESGLSPSGTVDAATAIALGLEASSVLGLTQGASGNKVVELQNQLISAGHRPAGGADGIFGPATTSALQAFQKAKGLSSSGTVDASTAAALAAVSGGTAVEPAAQPSAQPGSTASAAGVAGLKIGSRGDAVKNLQQALIDLGFTVVGGADGIYGVLTANAVKSFQNANGIATSGAVDDSTATALESAKGTDGSGGGTAHDPTVSSPFVGLQYGSMGADVKGLQQALISAGVNVYGGADGIYGTYTVTAVKEFQAKHSLSRSGKVDQDTANALSSRNPNGGNGTASVVGLKAGALGNTVKQLQQSLIDAGITVRGGADGIFGPATAGALKSFQTAQGLPATGVVDQATADALAKPKAPSSPSSPGSTDGFAQFGERGQRVVDLQKALINAGLSFAGGADGAFGSATSGAIMSFQRQKGLPVTGKIDDATAKALGIGAGPKPATPDPAKLKLDVFPVQGPCGFGDSYGYPRSGGRTHQGIDVIAAKGNLLYAVADGKITKVYEEYPGSLAGNGIRLTMADGTYFFYAHMDELADGIELGVPVKAGQVVGTVGNTGNSGTPHLHFEAHPKGGAAVNPYQALKAIDACDVTKPRG